MVPFHMYGFIPSPLHIEDLPELSCLPLNVMFGNDEVTPEGNPVFKSSLYEPDFLTFKKSESNKFGMIYRNKLDARYWLEIICDEQKRYTGTKYKEKTMLGSANGPDWKTFFIHLTLLGIAEGEKCETVETSSTAAVKVEEVNRLASALSVQQIESLSDEEIMYMAMERPEHPGTFGFLLNPQYFRQGEHLAETMHALIQRLGKVGHMKEKKAETWKKVTPEEFGKGHSAAVRAVREKISTGKGNPEKQKICPHLDLSGDLLHGPCMCDECGAVLVDT